MIKFIVIEQFTKGGMMILFFFIAILIGLMITFALKMAEMAYVMRHKKPFFVFTPFFLKKLNPSQKLILLYQFPFYSKLNSRHKTYFEHRVASFIVDKHFIGREGLQISEEMKVLISATAVMLTFGFRDFYGLSYQWSSDGDHFFTNFYAGYNQGLLSSPHFAETDSITLID